MRAATLLLGALVAVVPVQPAELPEYQLKAAFLYNFALFTEWPAETGPTLKLCVYGKDPFGPTIDSLQGKAVAHRQLEIERRPAGDALAGCQLVFIPQTAAADLSATVRKLRGIPVLTVAESPGATRQGVVLNMAVARDKVTFAANLAAARQAGLTLSSKLLQLATEVTR